MITLAYVKDLPEIAKLAQPFMAESSKISRRFSPRLFVSNWTNLINNGMGGVFIDTMDGLIIGALGAVLYPDMNSGELVATEFFWFVMPKFRGGITGISLYKAYEKWAIDSGCDQMRMGLLVDSMPEKLNDLYLSLGYTKTEIAYTKDLTNAAST